MFRFWFALCKNNILFCPLTRLIPLVRLFWFNFLQCVLVHDAMLNVSESWYVSSIIKYVQPCYFI